MSNTLNVNFEEAEVILQVIRGEKPWTVLESIGLNIVFEHDLCRVEGKGKAVVTPAITDVACGFAQLQSNISELRKWAIIILAASAVIDLVKIEHHQFGNSLIEILWDVAYGQPVSEEAINLIEKLVEDYRLK